MSIMILFEKGQSPKGQIQAQEPALFDSDIFREACRKIVNGRWQNLSERKQYVFESLVL